MNRRSGQVFAILSLVATAGVPVFFVLLRSGMFTFTDDFTGLKAVGFFITWALVLLVTGAVLAGLAWRADRRSWLVRCAVGLNGALLAGVLSLVAALAF